jgi:DNA primase
MKYYQLKKLIFSQSDFPSFLEQEIGVKLVRLEEGKYKCRCPFPFHRDLKPSFSLDYIDGGWKWYCYGCAEGGTIVEFVQKYYSISYEESIEKICSIFEISNDPQSCIEAMKRTEGIRPQRKEIEAEHILLSHTCRHLLRDYPDDKDTIKLVKRIYVETNEALSLWNLEKIKNLRMEIKKTIS